MATRAWNPWSEVVTLREAMNQLMEDSFIRPGAAVRGATNTGTFSFPLNVYGTADELKVEALLPGVSPEDVQIDLDRGVLTIAPRLGGRRRPALVPARGPARPIQPLADPALPGRGREGRRQLHQRCPDIDPA
jgi:hypothetical protein